MASTGFKVGVYTLSFMGFRAACLEAFHPRHRKDMSLNDKTYIVTGATGTIGRCTAFGLATRKARVIMACRDMEECKMIRREIVFKTGNRNIVCRKLDLSSVKSINEFADNILENEPRIDGLVNNAAHYDSERRHRRITYEGFEMHLGVNFLGPFLLTMRLLDKLIESSKITGDSRVVNVIGSPKRNWHIEFSNVNLNHGYNRKRAYNQSKLALAMFTRDLASRMEQEKHNVFVFGVDPGGPISRDVMKKFTQVKPTDRFYREYLQFFTIFFLSPDKGAAKSIYCAISKDLARHECSGKLYKYRMKPYKWHKNVLDEDVSQKVMLLAKKWVHLDKDVDKIHA